ncbi:MAG: PSD1 domain-containing protein [Planctomycetales bacterium]|nr:PSD1 domain-containing protein [Planctomycetales bacterium]
MDFNRDVRPILSDKCFLCHGPDSASREADLRLDVEASVLEDRGDYAVVSPGRPEASELLRRIASDDEYEVMPPPQTGKSISSEEAAVLRRWIADGAAWALPWAYIPPRETPPAPLVNQWSANWIDDYLLARWEQEELTPAPDADKVTLIRRLCFDLTGLPPTPEEVAQFVADESPTAYERLVDRLLASPRFGERMATYWLDLVRFADTVGYHGDQDHNIWPYRDYVIHAFNCNKPFDEFTREQLAGDMLDDGGVDALIASGYNRLLQTTHEGGAQLKEYRAIYMADRVRNFSQVWLGGTMGCAQCHDHKYDPYTTADFYAMGAFFADIDDEAHLADQYAAGLNEIPTIRKPELEVLSVYQRERLSDLRAELQTLQAEKDAKQIARVAGEIAAIAGAPGKTMIVKRLATPREVRLLPRGNWMDETGPVMAPAVPPFLGEIKPADGRRATRLDLANWLFDADEGVGLLTARVMVNRFWYLMFGRGIAPTLDDFGGQGHPPEHPELLDQLALQFQQSGWDVKHMLRLIALSHAYRQSSVATPEQLAVDPHNALVARQGRYRVPAEMVRDTALEVSGLLTDRLGGPSAKPYQPVGYYRHLNFPERKYHSDKNANQWRRGAYVHWQRQFLHPTLKALDAPSREECTAQRPQSNTPVASLALLNDPSFVEAARALAARIVAEGGSTVDERLRFAFLQCMSRAPAAEETRLMAGLLQEHQAYYRDNPQQVSVALGVGIWQQDAQRTPADAAELAAWSGVARALLNASETFTRN